MGLGIEIVSQEVIMLVCMGFNTAIRHYLESTLEYLSEAKNMRQGAIVPWFVRESIASRLGI